MVKIGILGLGNVGTGVVRLLEQNRDVIGRRLGTEVSVKKILVRDTSKPRIPAAVGKITDRPEDILEDEEISVIVEVMGGEEPAHSYVKQALSRGKSVVTANKELVAEHGQELSECAQRAGVNLLFEGSVGGGIPIIRPMKECLVANEVSLVMGILNGTTNYILTGMDERGIDIDDGLSEARALGYAEGDPSSDLNGTDAARKIAILASLAFNTCIKPRQIETSGIEKASLADVRYASELGYKVKLIAYAVRRGEGVEAGVAPGLIRADHPLASVKNAYNGILLEGDAVGRVMFYGMGAGGMPTASAVVGDIVEAVRTKDSPAAQRSHYRGREVLSPRRTVSSFYVRLSAPDNPEVLPWISDAFGRNGIALSVALRKSATHGVAEVVLVTRQVEMGKLDYALREIRASEKVAEVSNLIRVWEGHNDLTLMRTRAEANTHSGAKYCRDPLFDL